MDVKPRREVHKDLGLRHTDIFRVLEYFLRDTEHTIDGLNVTVLHPPGRVEIRISDEGVRVLTPVVSVPTTKVALSFFGLDDAAVGAYMQRFDMNFLRAGG